MTGSLHIKNNTYYMLDWDSKMKHYVKQVTWQHYHTITTKPIIPYFMPLKLTIQSGQADTYPTVLRALFDSLTIGWQKWEHHGFHVKAHPFKFSQGVGGCGTLGADFLQSRFKSDLAEASKAPVEILHAGTGEKVIGVCERLVCGIGNFHGGTLRLASERGYGTKVECNQFRGRHRND